MGYKKNLKIIRRAAVELAQHGAPSAYRHPLGWMVAINHYRRMKRIMKIRKCDPVVAANIYLMYNAKPKNLKKKRA